MEVCIAHMRGKPVMLALRDGIVTINGEMQPVKGLTEAHLRDFTQQIDAIPYSPDPAYEPGYTALVNARRAAFLAGLLGRAVGDDCMNYISHILDHVHMDVLEYLGEDVPR